MRLFNNIIVQLSLLALLLVCAQPALTHYTQATKDATIVRSTASCPDCPNSNCNECAQGLRKTLVANTGGLAYIRMIIGFTLPVEKSQVRACHLSLPGFVIPLKSNVTVNFWQAVSSDWDEATITGNNAPDAGAQIASVTVPANTNMTAVDITPACLNADEEGNFSVYVGTQFDRIELWSKESGNPAILHIVDAD
ncbi:hypothetical protein DL89DRAFT_268980 [Linderina pennispora]|uniref:Carbohydrate-binding module family 96 domain-containing protein n=1 Tax=Linderina pennispora TaxID=61395 RepID=A0A1Y1W3A2_9FUNG|nr:uncharacterized protein DL89DRAFT_268980 [Linderina pennispora]ORX67766.1 hypothetical protein DL89DRAFT_268980 [Linderina pennispora]